MKGFDEIQVCGAPTRERLQDKFLCLDCKAICDVEQCACGNGIHIKISRDDRGFLAMQEGTTEEWEGDSDGWHYCGAPRGLASTIQYAIDELIEKLCVEWDVDDLKYSWS